MHRPPSYARLANAVKEFPARASSTCASAWRATLRFDGARRPPRAWARGRSGLAPSKVGADRHEPATGQL